ncbi:MAG: YibE/F family protein [Lachnospiraceae bacterium]|nr:YibE/F family protein [Lachnospiraceae bacterium]
MNSLKMKLKSVKIRKTWASVLVCILLIAVLIFIPTGFEEAGAAYRDGGERVAAKVISVDNSTVVNTGLVQAGEQSCEVTLLAGSHKGETWWATNKLSGSLEQDKIYEEGDRALVLVSFNEGEVSSVSMIDHYRLDLEIVLLAAFFLFLILFARGTGLRAILSFVLSVLAIWKVLVPCCLKGMDPILVGGAITALLTFMIIALVFGFDRRTLAAVTGALSGLVLTCMLGILCTDTFRIQGAVMSFSETLLYSGYENLDLTRIFMASIFVGSSGAMMDLTVDITAAVNEVVQKRPDLSRWEAARSGMHVGQAAMGTMTTTLLLAYSGGYIALLMVFMAQGTPIINILNYKYVTSEIIHTLVGSFGLVLAAPLTALTSGWFLAGRNVQTDVPVENDEEI